MLNQRQQQELAQHFEDRERRTGYRYRRDLDLEERDNQTEITVTMFREEPRKR